MSRATLRSDGATGLRMNGVEKLISLISLGTGLRRRLDRIADAEAAETLGQPIEPDVNARRGVERKHLADDQAADDGHAEGMAKLRSGARPESEGKAAEECRKRGHHGRTEAQQAGLIDRFLRRLAMFPLRLERDAGHRDCVLLHNAHEPA